MKAESVALIPECVECEARWLPADEERWQAWLTHTGHEPAESRKKGKAVLVKTSKPLHHRCLGVDDRPRLDRHGVGRYRDGFDRCATPGEKHRKAVTDASRPPPAGTG